MVVLATGALFYEWWRSGKHTAVVAASSFPVTVTGALPPGTGGSTATIADIDLVKNGTLAEYQITTVSKAFEKLFQNPEWTSEVNLQGQRVVVFHGTVKYPILKEAGFYIGTWNGVAQGLEAEKQISKMKHRCYVEAGQTQTADSDEATIAPCLAKAIQSIVIPVVFEFALSHDKKAVEMTSFDPVFQTFGVDHRLRKDRAATLAFIYQ